MIPKDLAALAVPIDTLTPYDENPRQGDVGAIVTSLEANGQYRPIVVNRRSKKELVIVAGNHTFFAARELGWSEIAATFITVDRATEKRIVLIDNKANDLATYDEQTLTEMLTAIAEAEGPEGLLGTGFDADELDDMLRELPDFTPGTDDGTRLDRKSITTCPECGHDFTPVTRTVTGDETPADE